MMRKQTSILVTFLVGLFLIAGPGVASAEYPPCDKKALHDEHEQFKKDEDALHKQNEKDEEALHKANKEDEEALHKANKEDADTKEEKKAEEERHKQAKKDEEERHKQAKKDEDDRHKAAEKAENDRYKARKEECKELGFHVADADDESTSATLPQRGLTVTVGMLALGALVAIGALVFIRRRRFSNLNR